MRIHFETEPGQLFERGPVALTHRLACREQQVGVEIETARGGDSGVERAQSASGRIPWIGEAGEALLLALGIQALEPAPVHDRLAARFELGLFSRSRQRQ